MKPAEYKILKSIAVIFIVLLYFFFDARKYPFPRCPFFLVTHLYCPGCGSQRALSSLLHGHLITSLHNNLLLVAFTPLLLYSGYMSLKSKGAGVVKMFYQPLFVRVVLITILLFWLLRNIHFFPFTLLAPVS